MTRWEAADIDSDTHTCKASPPDCGRAAGRSPKESLELYGGLVRHIARQLRGPAAATGALDFEDLVAEGSIAVLEAVEKYRGDGRYAERSWVAYRVRHRMIDAIRRMSIRSPRASEDGAGEQASEVAPAPSRTRRQRVRAVPLHAVVGHDELSVSRAMEHRTAVSMIDELRRRESLDGALAQLSGRQRKVIELRLEGIRQKEIGTQLGVSEARVCQIQKSSVSRLSELLVGECNTAA